MIYYYIKAKGLSSDGSFALWVHLRGENRVWIGNTMRLFDGMCQKANSKTAVIIFFVIYGNVKKRNQEESVTK